MTLIICVKTYKKFGLVAKIGVGTLVCLIYIQNVKVPQQKRKSLVHIASAICSEKTRNPDFGYPIRALILLASSDTSKRIMGDVFTVQGFV